MGEYLLFFLFVAGVFWIFRRRKEKVYYGQTLGDVASPYEIDRPSSETNDEAGASDVPEKLSMAKRIYGIVFLSVWLSGWSVGCYFALRERLKLSYGDEGYIFMTIWLAAAIPAWFFAAWTLFRLLRGDDVEFNTDDSD